MTDAPCLTSALRLIGLGYRVLPINPSDKKPLGELVPNGLKNASANENTVRAWWRRRPDANLAVETSGCCVVDLDPCDGKPNQWLNTLDEPLVTNMTSTTPRGGSHLWFADPTGALKNSTSKLAPNVDTRATNGYVLVAPSINNGGAYDWTAGPVALTDLPVVPEWLVAKLKHSPPVPSPPAPVNDIHHSSADDRQTALAALRVLDPSSHYDDWLRIGMALHSVDASLLENWDGWSQGSDKYTSGACAEKWNGFAAGGGGVSIGTLCHMADATGHRWRPQPVAKAAASPPPATQRILAPGSRVMAGDMGNIATVVNDGGGSSVTVHFVSPSGNEATKDIPRELLKFEDGTPVVPSASPAIIIRAAGQLIGEFTEMRPAILEGLLRLGETMNIIAAPKTGKSWLSMGLGLSVVSGRKWLGRFWTRRGKVLIVDNELHPETSAHRLPRIAEAMGIQRSEYADDLYVANLRGQLTDLNRLSEQLIRLERGAFDLIVLDAFYRFYRVA